VTATVMVIHGLPVLHGGPPDCLGPQDLDLAHLDQDMDPVDQAVICSMRSAEELEYTEQPEEAEDSITS
jgi:hypothetical protein